MAIQRNCDDIFYGHIISRKQAREVGMDRYYNGHPCKRGHYSERSVKWKACMKCERDKTRSPKYKAYVAEYREKNMENLQARKAEWEANNPNWKKEYYQKNKNFVESRKREYEERVGKKMRRERYKNDPVFKSACNMRSMLWKVLKQCGKGKTSSTENHMGYSSMELKSHIENRMIDGMTWENRGDWHVDHLKPVAKFIEEGETDPKVINALENLAPMWASHNMDKHTHDLKEWLKDKGEDSEEWRLYSRYL